MNGIQIDRNSPDVSIYLEIGEEKLSIAKIGPNRFTMRERRDLPAVEGRLVIIVDGKRRSRTIMLPHGASSNSASVSYF